MNDLAVTIDEEAITLLPDDPGYNYTSFTPRVFHYTAALPHSSSGFVLANVSNSSSNNNSSSTVIVIAVVVLLLLLLVLGHDLILE